MICKEINGQIYFFKFGLKYIILLKQFLQSIESEDVLIKRLFQLSLSHSEDWESVYASCPNPKIFLLLSLKDSFNLDGSFEEIKQILLEMNPSRLDELYKILVGEVGIPPSQFYEMTLHEAELAYQGYIRKKELEMNCLTLAIRNASNPNAQPVVLLKKPGYQKSTLEERQKTFKKLNILEE